MAQRRMFSMRIIDSTKFLKMPLSSRLLYYDLGMRADDDGIVEAFNVLRMTGSTEDDLRVLMAKGYIKVLNDDLVTYIVDWKEHNKIRADRKVDSMYKDLLLQIIPEVELVEAKKRADRKEKIGDDNGTSQGQPSVSIGKDRLGKDSIGKDRSEKDSQETHQLQPLFFPTPFHKIISEQVVESETAYRTWFMNTEISENDNFIIIKNKEEFFKETIEKRYLKLLEIIFKKKIILE